MVNILIALTHTMVGCIDIVAGFWYHKWMRDERERDGGTCAIRTAAGSLNSWNSSSDDDASVIALDL